MRRGIIIRWSLSHLGYPKIRYVIFLVQKGSFFALCFCAWSSSINSIGSFSALLCILTAFRSAQLFTFPNSPIYSLAYTALSTGLGQAELLGLRWRDVDMDMDMLSISVSQVLYRRRGVCQFKEPKTSHSRRRVAMTPKLASFLREYKAERESICW